MTTPANQIASHAGIVSYLSLGVFRGKVPLLPNWNFALRSPMLECALYAYDVENPMDRSQRIRVHMDGGVLGYYVLGVDGFRFQPVPIQDIRIITGFGKPPIMYSEYIEQERIRDVEKAAIQAERKARDARSAVSKAIAYAEECEREAIKARERAFRATGKL
jgi:hypothetical protein